MLVAKVAGSGLIGDLLECRDDRQDDNIRGETSGCVQGCAPREMQKPNSHLVRRGRLGEKLSEEKYREFGFV